jgi:hypothetical protein
MKQGMTFWSDIYYRSRRVRWDKFLRRFCWAVVIAIALVVAISVVYLAFVPVSDIMAKHDVGTITGPDRTAALQAARDAVRNRLLGALAGLVALGALLYTARTFGLSREGQATDRLAKAIGQLGDTSLEVRVGAIYALELICRDSPRNQQAVINLLAAFARVQSKPQTPASAKDVPPANDSRPIMLPDVLDVRVAVEVIGRRKHERKMKVDLSKTFLAGAHLAWAHLAGADLTCADLTGANLAWANLAGANLSGADLTGADLRHARLRNAILKDAHLRGANLEHLYGSHLTGVQHLRGALLGTAHFPAANLKNANLREAKVPAADFTDADLTNACWPAVNKPRQAGNAFWVASLREPNGWQLDPNSGRLKRADANPGGTPTDPPTGV